MADSTLLTLTDLPNEAVTDQPVFVRVDFNVPMKGTPEQGEQVLDATRIEAALPTLRALLARGAKLVLGSHRGRPKGHPDPALSLAPVARELAQRLGEPVTACTATIGEEAEAAVAELGTTADTARVLLLENLRFDAGEKANSPEFVDALSRLASCYVNDAFGTAHRAHASTTGLASATLHRAAGLLLEKEVEVLGGLLEQPQRPFLAILGGAKISGKLETMQSLVEVADQLAVGGGMANTLLKALGHELGSSLVEDDLLDVAKTILARCQERGVELLLPEDLVVTSSLEGDQSPTVVKLGEPIEAGAMAVDIGPNSRTQLASAIGKASTVFWNGPMGVFEVSPYDEGSVAVAKALANCEGFTSVGGGETVAAVKAAGGAESIDHISTGGGASLELLAGKPLPGVEALRNGSHHQPASGAAQ